MITFLWVYFYVTAFFFSLKIIFFFIANYQKIKNVTNLFILGMKQQKRAKPKQLSPGEIADLEAKVRNAEMWQKKYFELLSKEK